MNRLWCALLAPLLCLYAAPADTSAVFKQYCSACHGNSASPAGGISLTKLSAQPGSMGSHFQQWEKIAAALEEKRMPPAKMPQPTDAARADAVKWIRTSLHSAAMKNPGDPGRVTVRRLTGGEYAYTIRDLIGFDLKFDSDFGSDAVGGEGFANYGDVQYMQDAKLERYLEAAKRVAAHAVIGAGPLEFYPDAGKSGFELSAINRIHSIYRENGFRAASAEGGRPFGLERYAKAFYAAWRYQHRAALGEPNATLEAIGAREGLSPRFTQHIWGVVQQKSPSYPTSDIVTRFRELPKPGPDVEAKVRAGAEEMQKHLINWPRWLFAAGELAAGGQGDERALVLTDESVIAKPSSRFHYFWRGRPKQTTRIYLNALPANANAKDNAVVIWRNPVVRFRRGDRSAAPEQPFMSLLDKATIEKLNFGKRPDGGPIDPTDFASKPGETVTFDVVSPDNSGFGEITIEAVLSDGANGDVVLRCTVADREDLSKGRAPGWALLGHPDKEGFKKWKAGLIEFAANLPQTSHGEPTPADRDPIPPPYNNDYNQPERDLYHTSVKYYRSDRFLVEKMLDDATRTRLEDAWADLYSSFEYHDTILRFISEKYKLNLKQNVASLTPAQIDSLPAEPKQYVQALKTEYEWAENAEIAAQPGHLDDCLRFAEKAWRRPLTPAEKDRLRAFYTKSRENSKLDHEHSTRLLLTRILVSPAFLYRFEQQQPARSASTSRALTDSELANRLSYFLWSSAPDAELARAARAGELQNPKELARQAKRMLADPKARRFSTEFFGQWLGFYNFDEYRGVDTSRFPEFTPEVKAAMYDEAVSFFEHIVRNDRPVDEMFSADYTFLNAPLAKHYGIKDVKSKTDLEMVKDATTSHRGGMLRLGAVLTATSAPLRTSPVKRGDWVLRRVLGTPTPPPPADAGSIPADPKAFGGQSLKERLASHQRNATCAACHTKIDPLGFPLERYDAVGRWRDAYEDGKPVADSSKTGDDTEIAGVDGLLNYLRAHEGQVLKTFSQKLLGYALGRTMLVTDLPLIEKMSQTGNTKFSALIQQIVTSKQFRYRRADDANPAPVTTASSQNKTGVQP